MVNARLFKTCFLLIWLHLGNGISAQQQEQKTLLTIGDRAPAILVDEWIKGSPVTSFENGKIYVVEFWATWCAPCLRAMPKLSKVAHKYRNSVTTISINVWEKKGYSKARGKAIVDSMGRRIKYAVAFEDSNKMSAQWLDITWNAAVPSAYVVDGNGRITWIGHPGKLDAALKQITNNTWDIDAAAAKRNQQYYLSELDREAREDYMPFFREGYPADFMGQPDSTLYYVNKWVGKEPDLQFAYNTTFHTFAALLKTDMKKAYGYAKEALQPSNPLGAEYTAIIYGITNFSKLLPISADLYGLGADAIVSYVGKIRNTKYDLLAAEWYWRAGNKTKAMQSLKNARKAMKKTKVFGMGVVL